MLQRFGDYGQDCTSMQAIAEAHSLSRQHVSVVTIDVLKRIESDVLPNDLLDHIRYAIAPHTPATVDELEAKLRQRLGPSLSIKEGERFARKAFLA